MSRYLIVANQTLAGAHLLEEVRRRIDEGATHLHVVVPATPMTDQFTHTEGEAIAAAEARLEHALRTFGALGVEVTGEVGSQRPIDAIRDTLRERTFDSIILSTLPAGVSRWLGMDLPHRVERTFDLPVTHVVAETQPTAP